MTLRARGLPLALATLLVGILAFGFVLGASVPKDSIYRYLNVFAEVYSLVRGNYVDPVDEGALMEGAYKGMVGGLDLFSGYLSKEEFQVIQKDPVGGPADTGIDIVKRPGAAEIVAVRPGSPADKSGLRPGDQLWSVEGVPTRQMSLLQLRRSQHGADGSVLRALVFHPKTQKREDLHLARSLPTGLAFESRVLEGKLGYLRITNLERADRDGVKAALTALRQKGANRLLLDLRACAAGGVDDAVRLGGLFVSPGPVVVVQDRAGEKVTKASTTPAVWSLPVYVLADGGSAGGAEVLAAALRSRLKSQVLGETTYGLGSQQQFVPLPNGDGLLISAEKLVSPTGESWNKTGLKPDKEIVSTPDARAGIEPDAQLQKAVEFLQVATAKAA